MTALVFAAIWGFLVAIAMYGPDNHRGKAGLASLPVAWLVLLLNGGFGILS